MIPHSYTPIHKEHPMNDLNYPMMFAHLSGIVQGNILAAKQGKLMGSSDKDILEHLLQRLEIGLKEVRDVSSNIPA